MKFLVDLREHSGMEDWQVRQAKHALKILYEVFLPEYAPQNKNRPSGCAGKGSEGTRHRLGDKSRQQPIKGAQRQIDARSGSPLSVSQNSRMHVKTTQRGDAEQFRDCVIPGEVERLFSPLLNALKTAIRSRHYSIRTETAYLDWVRRFIAFHSYIDPRKIDSEPAVKTFLDFLAVERKVAASTQNQALNALVFFFNHALEKPFGEMETFIKAKRPKRLPEVLSGDEIKTFFAQLEGLYALMAGLMYGDGLRLMECVRLRIKDIDFHRHQLMVRDGKGQKDRVTMLPGKFSLPLQEHIARVKTIYETDRANGVPGVYIWPALARKYPKAAVQWIWQYVFPAKGLSVDPRGGTVRRHHLNEDLVQKAVKEAAVKAGINKRVSCHVLRHSFLESHYDIRTVQELLGHADVSTTKLFNCVPSEF